MTVPRLLATAIVTAFFFLLTWFYTTNVYQLHFYDRGLGVVFWQMGRIAYMAYLVWLQYAVGAFVLRRWPVAADRCQHYILAFLLGTSIWHLVLFAVGMAGLLYYPVMLLLAGGAMIASWPQLCRALAWRGLPAFTRGEIFLAFILFLSVLLFIACKGAYPSGGHDFFNHYFPYDREVVQTGNLGPHQTWYHYFYSKGLGLYFMSMILVDPFAIQLVGATFIFLAACMMYDFLRVPGESRLLPLFGVILYFLLYTYTRGRGLFAANGGWGDLEKTHELGAVLLLGSVWLTRQWFASRARGTLITLCATAATLSLITFQSGALIGLFFALMLGFALLRKDRAFARAMFIAGAATGAMLALILLINYIKTGVPLDYFINVMWPYIGWSKVMAGGFSLELITALRYIISYNEAEMGLDRSLHVAFSHYYRMYMLWPLLVVGLIMLFSPRSRKGLAKEATLWIFLFATFLFALFGGGRTVPVSFFRYSSFNYAPALLACLLLWRTAHPRLQKYVITISLVVLVPWVIFREPHVAKGWWRLTHSALALNTGNYSLREAVGDQSGRVGRLKGGGVYPAMDAIYSAMPAGTRIWSFHNHSYCMLPACNVQQFFSQVTSPRWYDIALGSIDDGKKIMQAEGLNFFFYSRSVPIVGAAETQDELAAFYPGFRPENIGMTFGILWTNGWDYLLTWKEEATRPLDDDFIDSWIIYNKNFLEPRRKEFPAEKLAKIMKEAVDKNDYSHMPTREDVRGD